MTLFVTNRPTVAKNNFSLRLIKMYKYDWATIFDNSYLNKISDASSRSSSLLEEVLRSFTSGKVSVHSCKNTPLQIKLCLKIPP